MIITLPGGSVHFTSWACMGCGKSFFSRRSYIVLTCSVFAPGRRGGTRNHLLWCRDLYLIISFLICFFPYLALHLSGLSSLDIKSRIASLRTSHVFFFLLLRAVPLYHNLSFTM